MISYNGLTLAYVGDAYYELKIRDYCLLKGLTLVNDLHNQAINYTRSSNQSFAAKELYDNHYDDVEKGVFRRGRNQTAKHKPKNVDGQTYNNSTGFEAVIGYLYLKNDLERCHKIIDIAIKTIEEKSLNN
jgi:ribonuclease-3 family protein